MQSTCVCCEKDYDTEDSTATNNDKDNFRALYCSEECEAIDQEWLVEGNKTIESAKQNNPSLFMRTSMTPEQSTAMDTFKKLGVRFTGTELSTNPQEREEDAN